MNELKSYTEYAVSTPTADFVIGFDFNYGEDAVNVTVDNVPATEAGYTVVYLNETTIRLSPSVSSGVVRLQRETDIDQSDHAYRAGAKFIAQTMDENFEQLRHSQQEVRDGFNKLADDTYEIIDTLQEVGQSAQDAADAAEVAAGLANDAAAQVNDKVSYEDFNNKPHNAMLGRDAEAAHPTGSILDGSGETQQQVNYNGGSKWHSRVGGYKLNERVVLTNGDIVKSTTDGNMNDPNADMVGWKLSNKIELDYIGNTVTPEQFKAPFELDDTNSVYQAIQYANENKGAVKFSARKYVVNNNMPTITNPMALFGYGQRKTWFELGKNVTGPLFSTYDVSFHTSGGSQLDQNSDTIDIDSERSGVAIFGFSIVGDRTTQNIQHGVVHYGLSDNLFINDIGGNNLTGMAWGTEYRANPSSSTGIRESYLGHIVARRCGSAEHDICGIEYFTSGFDPSNGVLIEKLDSIWPDGGAVRFKNTSLREDLGWARFIRVKSGMLHGREDTTGNPQTKPLLEVSGRWYASQFNFTEINGGRDGVFNVHFHKGSMGAGPRQCEINSAISGSNGIFIEHGRDVTLDCSTISVTSGGIHLKVGPEVLGNVFLSGSSEDLQYSRLNIVNETDSVNKVIKTKRGGPFLVDRSSTKNSLAGGLMPTPSGDGLRLGLLSDGGNSVTTALEILRYAGKTSGGADVELALTFLQNGLVFGDRSVKSDEPRQTYFESRSGLNLFIIQRTTYANRKAITWNSEIPVGGVWNVGDICYNSGASLGGASGWIYTSGGWQVLSQSGTPTSTTANMSSLAQSVNTASKFAAKQVINSTDNKMYYATGGLASDVWRSFDGATTITPI